MPLRLKKVLAYITRRADDRRELLVFTHRDFPGAGLQVPAGTVKDGEDVKKALLREVAEETGLTSFAEVNELGTYDYPHPVSGNVHERHVFHLEATSDLLETWEWLETGGGEMPEEEGIVFVFRWANLREDIQLAGGQGDFLHLLQAQH
ncbi:MAG TPA: NUDIX domain-containing protein [Chloroflexia bacterium]|nr:NUDIX domain-containing protein [Chloroflexia bacterium]